MTPPFYDALIRIVILAACGLAILKSHSAAAIGFAWLLVALTVVQRLTLRDRSR
jgi:hypothetical protein